MEDASNREAIVHVFCRSAIVICGNEEGCHGEEIASPPNVSLKVLPTLLVDQSLSQRSYRYDLHPMHRYSITTHRTEAKMRLSPPLLASSQATSPWLTQVVTPLDRVAVAPNIEMESLHIERVEAWPDIP